MTGILGLIFVFLNDGLPFVLVILPIYLFCRTAYLYDTERYGAMNSFDTAYEIILIGFTVFMTMLFVQTWCVNFGENSEINLIPFKIIRSEIINRNDSETDYQTFIFNIFGNIAVFVPVGLFGAYRFKRSLLKTIYFGFCLSLLIETVQIPLDRTTDVDDLILNTIGAILGGVLYKICTKNESHNSGE